MDGKYRDGKSWSNLLIRFSYKLYYIVDVKYIIVNYSVNRYIVNLNKEQMIFFYALDQKTMPILVSDKKRWITQTKWISFYIVMFLSPLEKAAAIE